MGNIPGESPNILKPTESIMNTSLFELYPLAYVYSCSLASLFLALMVKWISKRKFTGRFNKYGWVFAWTQVIMALLIVVVSGGLSYVTRLSASYLITCGVSLVISMLQVVMFTVVGMYYSGKLGITSLPLIFRRWPPSLPVPEPQPSPKIAQPDESGIWSDIPLDQQAWAHLPPASAVEAQPVLPPT
ncbi:MAG TPA: hypothetical protein VFF78_04815, partial [Anaerolineaceae bacterium]|nr:hypothetical protein [Anaerolineaceae bacterium]